MKTAALLMVGLGILPLAGCAMDAAETESVRAEEAAVLACNTSFGVYPTKAGLMVAMGDELGRWDPLHDLAMQTVNGVSSVVLSAKAKCLKNSCANTKGLLGQQNAGISSFIDQKVFSPTNYASDLYASFDRQSNLINNLTLNHPTQLPPAHKLTEVGGPVNLGTGACGAHYVFQADHLDGTPLSAAEAANMVNELGFYGYAADGSANPFIAFTVTGQGCPVGRTCVAVDPAAGDNGTPPTTTGQAAITYPMNRLWDPSNNMLGTQCITTANKAGTMVSKCAQLSSTCGFLYCIAP
jgi:hypothetical protein